MELDLSVETRELTHWLREFERVRPDEIGKMVRVTALTFVNYVAPATPHDTGRARGGWLPYADKHGTAPPAGPGSVTGRAESSFREDLVGHDQFVEITNGVPYIVPLELNHKEYAGFVRRSLKRTSSWVAENAKSSIDKADKRAERG